MEQERLVSSSITMPTPRLVTETSTRSGLELFRKLPTVIFVVLLNDFLGLDEQAAFAASHRAFSEFAELWLLFLRRATGRENSENARSSRSAHQPRQAYFNAVRLQWQRAAHRMVVSVRSAIDKGDSPARVRKVLVTLLPQFPKRRVVEQLLGDLMIHACYRGRWNCVKTMIQDGGTDKNYCNTGGSALIVAAWAGQLSMVKWLYSLGGVNTGSCSGLLQTSACGGQGPYSALEWAERKAVVCPDKAGFRQCAAFLRDK